MSKDPVKILANGLLLVNGIEYVPVPFVPEDIDEPAAACEKCGLHSICGELEATSPTFFSGNSCSHDGDRIWIAKDELVVFMQNRHNVAREAMISAYDEVDTLLESDDINDHERAIRVRYYANGIKEAMLP